jgi:hypothetical protein
MWSLITRFLPSLFGGITSLANPWIIAAGMAALGGSFFYGIHVESKNHDAYVAKAEALAAVQNAQTAIRIAEHKRLKEKADETYQRDLSRLAADLDLADERLRTARTKTSQRLVPAAPGGAAGNQRICADRELLNRELNEAINGAFGRYASKRLGSDKEGVRGINVGEVCREWSKALSQP